MALEQLKVREIVQQAVSKNVDIPEFQREFVWDAEQVKRLAESLHRDYPVGSFLLWDSSEYQESKTALGRQASLWIVDGQQRTTALCLLLGEKPYWWGDAQAWNKALERHDVMVNLLPDEDDDRLEFALPNPIRRRDPHWISIRRILGMKNHEDLKPVAKEIVKRVSGDAANTELFTELFIKVYDRLYGLWQIRERDIPIIKITHEVEEVAEIFARLNQEGTRVKEADVVLAIAAARNPGWVRNEYLPFRSQLEDGGWDLDAGIFVRTMTGIGKGRARLIEVPNDFWAPKNLPGVWKDAQETILEVLRRLAEHGIMSAELLPSTNSLIPLFVLHQRWKSNSGYSFERALHWFLQANRDGRYSGSAITSLNEDVRTITEATDFNQALENLSKRLQMTSEIAKDEFLNRYDRAGNRFLRLMLYLVLFHSEARDWVDDTRIGYDKTGAPITSGFKPEWHHIYPRSVLRKAGVSNDEIHALANITVLNKRTNVEDLASKHPSCYIQEFHITEQNLLRHLVPEAFANAANDKELLKEYWDNKRYGDFLKERAQLLAQKATTFLQNLRDGVNPSVSRLLN